MPVNQQGAEFPDLAETTAGEIEDMHRHVADFLSEQAVAGATDLVEIGYPEVNLEAARLHVTQKEIARAEASARRTAAAGTEPGGTAVTKPGPASGPKAAPARDRRPRPRSRRDWAARDMASGSSRKPFPYGTGED